MRKPLYIYGAGGLGREVMSWVIALEEWELRGFIDDSIPPGQIIHDLIVLGGADSIEALQGSHVVVAIGQPQIKAAIVQKIGNKVHFPTLIHPRCTIQHSESVRVGAGSILTAGVVITCDISIGEHVLVNLNSTIGHDVVIGSCSSIMPGVNIAGEVCIGNATMIGSGSNIRNKVRIGNNSIVGMGSVVLNDVADSTTVAGVPAKQLVGRSPS
jgi:sugar O-acyltransferase (sialic acid O-acetyltransferase NeuD family)